MMNADEAKKATNEMNKAIVQQICENIISKRIEDATLNGCNTTYHTDERYMYKENFYEAVKQYLENKGYKISLRNARAIIIEW